MQTEYHATVYHTRWMIRRDLPTVLKIEAATGGDWTEEDFLRHLRQTNCIGVMAEENWFNRPGPDAGFFLYELHRTNVELVKFAALPNANRDATGAAMFEKLAYKLTSHKRRKLDVSAILKPEWLTCTVQAMCRNTSRPYLPILADALEDAGCDARWLLDALRLNDATARKLYDGTRRAFR
jgi:[ribosomal protein S18]-alanine N-acetyltransferase